MADGVSSRFYDEIPRHLELRPRCEGAPGKGQGGRDRAAWGEGRRGEGEGRYMEGKREREWRTSEREKDTKVWFCYYVLPLLLIF